MSTLFRIQQDPSAEGVHEEYTFVEHERLFEDALTTPTSRPLYVGSGFSWKRLRWVFVCLAFSTGLLILRAGWMQIVQATHYQSLAESNRLRASVLWPRRGLVTDRMGVVLAQNHSRFDAVVIPSLLPRDHQAQLAYAQFVERTMGVDEGTWNDIVHATDTREMDEGIVKQKIPYEQAMTIAVSLPHFSGIELQLKPERSYPLSSSIESLSHVLGYVGKISQDEYEARALGGYRRLDEIGKTGVEKTYEGLLRGTLGERRIEVDAQGHEQGVVQERTPVDGAPVTLSLDVDLQRTAETELKNMMAIANVKRGSVVALDPRDGSILALVSLPAYDNNAFSGGVSSTVYQALSNNPDHPLFPRAWAGMYPSGSTIKIVYALAGLAEKVIDEHTSFVSTGGISVGPWFFPDWKAGGHGVTDVRKAIAWSVNTFFYELGGGYGSFQGLGIERLTEWLHRVGLGNKTGIDLPGESDGFVPTPEWKQRTQNESWYIGDTYNVSIGQGDLLVTPVQVARYTALIANGGHAVTPHILKDKTLPSPEQIAPADAVRIVQAGMRDNVTYGSGRSLNTLSFPASGKTGTAQWNKDKRTHAWFTSYAPSDSPEIVVTVMLEEGGEGSSVSVPVAKKVLDAWWALRAARHGTF